ncbi:MAG: phosphoadenosine phosphosulfate reductase family protein [Candidatus Heimdallarchaeota archaeon]|nr:MAG: phosphoadenosine phosphosulfate reductase family protein [Candidatus Heimdallarchaeota archaeon]
MRIPYLGRIRFFWCDSCHVPLIRENCSLCAKKGRKIQLSPPGDVRPAFEGDLKRMVSVIRSQFGDVSAQKFQTLIENQVILLNKVPYVDRMDEIIFQGEVIGIFRFNLVKGNFELIPRISLAIELWNTQSKGWVAVDIGAREPIVKGASVLSPGVVFADLNISINDPVIIVCHDEVVAVGLAKMNGGQMGPQNKGVAVKTKYRKKTIKSSLRSTMITWERIIDANQHSLEILEKEAIEFIERTGKRFGRHVVAYSGGKDSLVTLDLVAHSNVLYEIIFSDTGIEYPETLENIRIIGQKYEKGVIIQKNEAWDFWERFDQYGPPSRNSRWCCKSAKLSPINEIMENIFPNDKQVLCYIGRRRYESLGRSREPRVSKNPWVPKQVIAAPINNWNAFEVFLYIQKYDLTEFLNPLYIKGYIRIGCWVCPASSLSDFEIMKESHPTLLNKLNKKLLNIQTQRGLPNQFTLWGLWRWKYLPQKIINLIKVENVPYTSSNYTIPDTNNLVFRITSDISPCIYGGFSTLLSANQMLDLSRIKSLTQILGSVQYNTELDILSIPMKNGHIDIFCDGSLILKNNDKNSLLKQISSLIRILYRATHCDGCGICIYSCRENALVIKSGIITVLEDQCIHCLKCNDFCPLIKYQNDDSFLTPSKRLEKPLS